MIERPSKRPRLSCAVETGNLPDDLDIQEARARNDMRLKSLFENIFRKYGRDFSDVGDEIDLRTGEIVVDNGHLSGMQREDDLGEKAGWLFDADEPASPDSPDHYSPSNSPVKGSDHGVNGDAGDFLHSNETKPVTTRIATSGTQKTSETEAPRIEDSLDLDDDKASVDSLLGAALSVRNGNEDNVEINLSSGTEKPPIMTETMPFHGKVTEPTVNDRQHRAGSVESIWRAPEIDAKFSTPIFSRAPRAPIPVVDGTRSASPPGARSLWALPTPGRKRNTDVVKKSKKQVVPARRKRKCRSTITVRDWSFAAQPDGSESDDPLQEDYQPSPTAKPALIIRNARGITVTQNATKSTSESSEELVSASKVPRSGQNSTSTDTKRSKTPMTPDEVKLIVKMRKVQKSGWKEIVDRLPGRTLAHITQWHHYHWTERRANPPLLSKPWSEEERKKLNRLKDHSGLSWQAMRAELPGRSQAEIEFELMRLWVGDEIWENDGKDQPGRPSSQLTATGQEQKQDKDTAFTTPDSVTAGQNMPLPTSTEGDPSIPQKHKDQSNIDPLAENSNETQTPSRLSLIQIEARQKGSSAARRKKSPAKA